jgi:hypothetical protein
MKLLLKILSMLEDDPLNLANRPGRDSHIAGQADRIEPKFTFTLRHFDMDVCRFVPFVGIKVETK